MCLSVCFFMLSFPVGLSELVIQSSTLSNKRGRKREKVRKRKKKKELVLASKLNRRCLDETVVPSVKIREFDPFAVRPAAKNDTIKA